MIETINLSGWEILGIIWAVLCVITAIIFLVGIHNAHEEPEPICIASRGRGKVDEHGQIHMDTIEAYDIVAKSAYQKRKKYKKTFSSYREWWRSN